MCKVLVVYESTFGNTRTVAEKIAEGAEKVPGTQATVANLKKVKPAYFAEYDGVLIGCPTHMGQPTKDTRGLVEKLDQANIGGKRLAFFNCWNVPACEGKQVKALEMASLKTAPEIKLVSPGLSVKVPGFKGPVAEADLAKCVEFGVKFAEGMKN